MDKLKSSLSLAFNAHFRRTILINDEKTKTQPLFVLSSFICRNLLNLIIKPHNRIKRI